MMSWFWTFDKFIIPLLFMIFLAFFAWSFPTVIFLFNIFKWIIPSKDQAIWQEALVSTMNISVFCYSKPSITILSNKMNENSSLYYFYLVTTLACSLFFFNFQHTLIWCFFSTDRYHQIYQLFCYCKFLLKGLLKTYIFSYKYFEHTCHSYFTCPWKLPQREQFLLPRSCQFFLLHWTSSGVSISICCVILES